MWYAIIAGAFLAVGLGLLIWGLIERKKRYESELKLKESQLEVQRRGSIIDDLGYQAGTLRAELDKSAQQVDVIRNRLEVTRAKLMACDDPKVVKLWLDNEMNDKSV